MAVKFYKSENQVPLEMHKVRMIQKLELLPVEERLKKIQTAGNNTFLLQNRDIYMDMLTDSGVNGMSDLQFAAMMRADDSYAGSETFNRVKAAVKEVFGTENVLPTHQGRACENILAEAYVKPGKVALMNFHFTTTKAHITRMGGSVEELVDKKGLLPQSNDPLKVTSICKICVLVLMKSVLKTSLSSELRRARTLSEDNRSLWKTCWL